jgi:hypothetical protein
VRIEFWNDFQTTPDNYDGTFLAQHREAARRFAALVDAHGGTRKPLTTSTRPRGPSRLSAVKDGFRPGPAGKETRVKPNDA